MNGSIIALTLAGCAGYVFLMSLLGKWLAYSSDRSTAGAVLTRSESARRGDAQPDLRETIAS